LGRTRGRRLVFVSSPYRRRLTGGLGPFGPAREPCCAFKRQGQCSQSTTLRSRLLGGWGTERSGPLVEVGVVALVVQAASAAAVAVAVAVAGAAVGRVHVALARRGRIGLVQAANAATTSHASLSATAVRRLDRDATVTRTAPPRARRAGSRLQLARRVALRAQTRRPRSFVMLRHF